MGYDQHGVGMHMIRHSKSLWTEKDDEALGLKLAKKNRTIRTDELNETIKESERQEKKNHNPIRSEV